MDHEQTLPTIPAADIPPTTAAQVLVDAPEQIQIIIPRPTSRDSNAALGHREVQPQEGSGQTSSSEKHLLASSDGYPTVSRSQGNNPYGDFERVLPPPPPPRSRDGQGRSRRRATMSPSGHGRNGSGIDWIVPVEERNELKRTIGERLQSTIDNAVIERDKYARKALWTGYALNVAIGVQVFLGALTTGISAAVTSVRQAQISTAVLGGLSTLVASYLARCRGSGEPELSASRVKNLDQFLRESRAFQMDHAHEFGTPENGLNERLDDFRRRLEELLGNVNGEKKRSPVGVDNTQAVP